MTLLETLTIKEYKPITDFTPRYQKILTNCIGMLPDNTYQIYAKIEEQMIEFSDNNNKPLWSTTIAFASVVILDPKNELFDKFVFAMKPFKIRNGYEFRSVTDILNDFEKELLEFDNFIDEEEFAYEC